MKQIYFPGLNAIRAWAAIFVVWYHIEHNKAYFQITTGSVEDYFFIGRYTMRGLDAVLLFFVLSGFLITYLLLNEIQNTNQLDVKKFYARRILRIWPLYYFVMFLGFFLVPLVVWLSQFQGYYPPVFENFLTKFMLYLFFLPPVAQMMGFIPVGIAHLWSISVEEIFYLLWPPLILFCQKKIIPAILLILLLRLIIIGALTLIIIFMPDFYPNSIQFWLRVILQYWLEGMAIGALGAYLYYHHQALISAFVSNPIVEMLIIAFFAVHITVFKSDSIGAYLGPFTMTALSIFYSILILRIVHSPKLIVNFDTASYELLGKLSYGIYLYHPLVIYFVMIGLEKIGWNDNGLGYNLFLYTVVTSLTILIAYFSYEHFESRFLRLKKRFQVIESGQS